MHSVTKIGTEENPVSCIWSCDLNISIHFSDSLKQSLLFPFLSLSLCPKIISHATEHSASEPEMIIYSSHKAIWTMLPKEKTLAAFLSSAQPQPRVLSFPPSLNDKVNPPGNPLRGAPELLSRPTKGPICTVWRYNAVISVENSRGSEEGNHPPPPGQCRIVDRTRGLGCWSSRLSSDLHGSTVWITALSLYQFKMKTLWLLKSIYTNRNCNKTDCLWNYENVVKITLKRD